MNGAKEMGSAMVKPGETIAVWFSCGAASAIAAKKTIEKYSEIATIRVINNPIKEEHEDNQRFLRDVQEWLGVTIEFATNTKYPSCSCVDVWNKRQFMSGPQGAPCTMELKKEARRQWEASNRADWIVLGFTLEERRRSDSFIKAERKNLLTVLIDEGITKPRCFQLLSEAGIQLPEIYTLGYPNANCIGCVKASSPTYWNHVRRVHPNEFDDRAKQSRAIGARLVRVDGERIFLDELDEKARGEPMGAMNFECGLFCEEEWPSRDVEQLGELNCS